MKRIDMRFETWKDEILVVLTLKRLRPALLFLIMAAFIHFVSKESDFISRKAKPDMVLRWYSWKTINC